MADYFEWMRRTLGHDMGTRQENHYTSVALKAREAFATSSFWERLPEELEELGARYAVERHFPLLVPISYELHIKSWSSFVLKSYRRNVLENADWPDPPASGWVTPENWFSRTKDIVRTLLLVKYLDGVEVVLSRIEQLARDAGFEAEGSFEATVEGYYAGHIVLSGSIEVPDLLYDTQKLPMHLEIQVSTQVQEVIRALLHRYYERRRKERPPEASWQWDYGSAEFETNYLGHVLHYVEGMIVAARDREESRT